MKSTLCLVFTALLSLSAQAQTSEGNVFWLPYTITLDEGQTYQVQASGDLSGSRIRSLNGQPIAVLSGARQADVLDCNGGADSHVYEQSIPVEQWGSRYHFVPFSGQGTDVLRILAAEDSTTVYFDANTIGGCIYFGEIEIMVENCGNNPCINLPPLNIIAASPYSIGNPLTFSTQASATLVDYEWAANNGDTGSEAIFSTTFDNPGVAAIELQALDANGCAYSAVKEAELINCGNPCEDLPPVSIELEGELCLDSTLQASAATEAELQAFTWNFGNGQSSNAATPSFSYEEEGLYTISLAASDESGCLYSEQLEFIIEDCSPPDPCADVPDLRILGGDSLLCTGEEVAFQAEGPDNLVLYDWQLGNGERSEEPSVSTVYEEPGLYSVILVAVDDESCNYSDNISFEVRFCEPEGGCSYEFPNAFTPNGDGTNDQFSLLSNCPLESYQLRIFNRWGQLVFETDQADQGWDGTFAGKAAPSEVYYYTATISDPNGNLEQRQGDLSLLR